MNDMTISRTPEVIATEINVIKAQARDVYVRSAIEIGKRLYEAKTMVAHGKWGRWLEENVEYSERTAQNLIAVYEEYGRSGNAQAIAGLSFTQAVLLLRLDGETRTELMESKDVPSMSTRELEEEIRRANAEIEERQVTIEQLMQADKEKTAAEERDKALIDEQRAEVEMMRAELEQAKTAAASAKAQAADAVERANAVAKENTALKGELETERSRTTMIEQVEVVPPEVEAELERLRKLEESGGASEQELKLKVTYTQTVEMLGKLEEIIRKLDESQPETATRYRRAVAAAMTKIAERLGGA